MNHDQKGPSGVWRLYLAELIGTTLLVALGVSAVIVDFAPTSPLPRLLPDPALRRALTGFLFGTVGALIAVSPVGRVSGAHINPAVTLAFLLQGRMTVRHALGYVVAQLAGGALGGLALLAWRPAGLSLAVGVTRPGPGWGVGAACAGEVLTTAALVLGIFVFVGHPRLRRFTPLLFPALYAVMVYLEAPISGTSTNPARTVGPALATGIWQAWWVYLVGPLAGAALAVVASRHRMLGWIEVEVAKVYHFAEDPLGVLSGRGHCSTAPSRTPSAGKDGHDTLPRNRRAPSWPAGHTTDPFDQEVSSWPTTGKPASVKRGCRGPQAGAGPEDDPNGVQASTNRAASSARIGRARKKPWAWVQPRSRTTVSCASVSTPSATTSRPSCAASATMVRMISRLPPSFSEPMTKERSILRMSMGNRCR